MFCIAEARSVDSSFKNLSSPWKLTDNVFEALHVHGDLWHQGRDWATTLVKQRFYWPRFDAYVKEKVQNCEIAV